jgi:hypothetical protein
MLEMPFRLQKADDQIIVISFADCSDLDNEAPTVAYWVVSSLQEMVREGARILIADMSAVRSHATATLGFSCLENQKNNLDDVYLCLTQQQNELRELLKMLNIGSTFTIVPSQEKAMSIVKNERLITSPQPWNFY